MKKSGATRARVWRVRRVVGSWLASCPGGLLMSDLNPVADLKLVVAINP